MKIIIESETVMNNYQALFQEGTKCLSCQKVLQGTWKFGTLMNAEWNSVGRHVGVQGFFLADLNRSDEEAPGWIIAYCGSCWKQGILEHSIVKALEDKVKTLSEEKSQNQSLHSQLQEERQKVQENADKIRVLETERDQLKAEKNELKRQNNAQRAEILQLRDEIKTVTRRKDEEITVLNKQKASKDVKLDEFALKLRVAEREISPLYQKYADVAAELSEEKNRCQTLQANLLVERQKVQDLLEQIREINRALNLERRKNQQSQYNRISKIKIPEEERGQLRIANQKAETDLQNLHHGFETSTKVQRAQILQLKDEINKRNSFNFVSQAEKKDIVLTGQNTSKKTHLSQEPAIQQEELKKISQKYEELEEQKSSVETISEILPSLSIQMDSVLDLNYPHGWKITTENFENVKTKKIVTVAVIGMYDVGKSWFCNEFTGKKLFNAGVTQRTDSLNCHFPTEDGNLIGLIDTPGSNEAIRCSQKDLIEKVEKAHFNEKHVEILNVTSDNHARSMLHYKILKNDARILQDLKEKFIREVADVLILICNKLSEKEQESIFKVIKYHNKIKKERTRKQELSGGANRRETLLYIVHNYKMLSEIEDVKVQIQRDLKDSFIVEEVPLFNITDEKSKGCNQMMYQDQFGISHLILAGKGTNAGKYYNTSTFRFLKEKINLIENRTSADVKRLFLDFCNKNIHSILKQENIQLKLNKDETAIVKVDSCPNVVLENLRYDEFGDFWVSTGYEPRYSVIQRKKENNKTEMVVEMDLINSSFQAILKRDIDGFYYLNIKGEKSLPVLKTGELSIRQDRERGSFDLNIKLLNLDNPKVKRDPPANAIDATKNGVVTWIFEFDSNSGGTEV